MGSKARGSSRPRGPAIWEKDWRQQQVRVRLEQARQPEEAAPEDWRRLSWRVLCGALALEAGAALLLQVGGVELGPERLGPLELPAVQWWEVMGVAGISELAALYAWWRMEQGLGRRTVEVLRDLKVGKGLKFPPRLRQERRLNAWVTDLYFECPPGLTDSKLALESTAVSQALRATVMDVFYDDDSGWVVMKLGAGKIPREIGFEDFCQRFAPPPGELVGPLWVGREGPTWIDVAEANMLVTGVNRSGKTNWLRVLLTYLALRTDCQLRLVDMKSGGVEFNVFQHLPHLGGRAIASTTGAARALLEDVAAELREREQLFASEGVNNFQAWNRRFPSRRLPWVLTVIDERHRLAPEAAPANSNERRDRRAIEEAEAVLVAQGAGAGFRVIDTTQLANVQVLPALIREQLVDRHLAFKAGTGSAARIPGMEPATHLRHKGRAIFAQSGEISTGQTPLLEYEDAERLLAGGGRLEPREDAVPDLHVVHSAGEREEEEEA